MQAAVDRKGYLVESDRRRAIELAVMVSRPHDAVLIAGKGHETYQIIGTKTIHFDDREEARKALRAVDRRQSVVSGLFPAELSRYKNQAAETDKGQLEIIND